MNRAPIFPLVLGLIAAVAHGQQSARIVHSCTSWMVRDMASVFTLIPGIVSAFTHACAFAVAPQSSTRTPFSMRSVTSLL